MLALLARASIEGALLAGGVWMLGRVLPRLSPTVKAVLWWCVAAKFLVALLWHVPIDVPVLAPRSADTAPVGAPMKPVGPPAAGAMGASNARGELPPASLPWTTILMTLWGTGLAVALARAARLVRETRRVVSRALPADAALQDIVRDLGHRLGMHRAAEVRLSSEIESPLITGARRPVILVPAHRFPRLSQEQQRMALCHELAHMQRGDLWLGCVPALVERCFFFHPVAHLAAREYAFWREAACDETVLATLGTSPQSYARLLLALGVSREPATFAAAGAAWSFSTLKRRIVMLQHPSPTSLGGRLVAAGAIAIAVVAVVPMRAVARTAAPSASAEPASPPFVVPAVGPAPAADAPAAPDVMPSAPAATMQERERRRTGDLRFVYLREKNSVTMSGSGDDVRRARRLQRQGEPLLWFERGGQDYVVRDPAVLRDVEEIWEQVNRIGEEQGRIGAKQGEIGAEQGRHGAKQGEIGAAQGLVGARQGVIGARLGLLAAREAVGASASERRDMERERAQLAREQRELDREMEALSRKMREVGTPGPDLGKDMEVLGRQMGELGRRMEAASRRADVDMRSLMERAVRSGAAEPVR